MDTSFLQLVVFLSTMFLQNVLSDAYLESYTEVLATSVARMTMTPYEERLDVWHSDCFSICDERLRQVVETACEYDPYRDISRRKRSVQFPLFTKDTDKRSIISAITSTTKQQKHPSIFFSKRSASQFLHRGSSKHVVLKRKKRSILDECCYNVCAWEEFGEYCHGYHRAHSQRQSTCQ